MKKNIKYQEVNLPAVGKDFFRDDSAARAFAVTFVYSNKGNFLIRGFWGETRIFLDAMVKDGYRFYYQYSFYMDGKARFTFTNFWDKSVTIIAPEKRHSRYSRNINKFEFRRDGLKLSLKRLPKRWIPEFNHI